MLKRVQGILDLAQELGVRVMLLGQHGMKFEQSDFCQGLMPSGPTFNLQLITSPFSCKGQLLIDVGLGL